jgi:hypothetical protein
VTRDASPTSGKPYDLAPHLIRGLSQPNAAALQRHALIIAGRKDKGEDVTMFDEAPLISLERHTFGHGPLHNQKVLQ